MTTRERRSDRGRAQATRTLQGLGAEIRRTRRGAGISLRTAAGAVGMSHATLGRLERGALANASVLQYALACAAVGLKLVSRAYICVEAEMRLDDLQALERRIALKRRDGGNPLVILLIADTESNRRRILAHRDALRSSFPLDSRVVLTALGAGRAPEAGGIVIL